MKELKQIKVVDPKDLEESMKTNKYNNDFLTNMKAMINKNLTDEQKKGYERLAEKFHQSFDVENQQQRDHNVQEIALEECLAYLVESLKSGLHPKHMTKMERDLVKSHFKDEWYTYFGYDRGDLEGMVDEEGIPILEE